jgi:hypothetical protein
MYMSKDKQKYLAAYVPESVPKETPKRSGIKSDGRTKEIEDAIAAFNELLAKQNRDNLDAMYNIDMGNMSSSMRRLFQSYDDGITKANASIEAWANAQEAGFKAIAEWQDETTSSISSIEGKADANGASIILLTEFQKKVEGGTIESIARIDQKADENAASIKLLTDWKGETSESLAALEILASQNESKISLLTQWQGTVDDEIEGLVATTAVIGIQADENSAAIESLAQFRRTVEDGSISSIAGIKQQADANSSSISLIAEWQRTVEDGSISSIASIDAKADANSAQITQLNQWKGTASSSIAAVQTLASQNGAKITSLTSWQSTVEDDLEGLSSSVAYIEELADENGASISQIVRAVGEDGEVSAASIVAAVNDAGSSVMLNADRINLDGDIYISGKNNYGDEAMRILGNKLQMLHFSGEDDSAASIAFWYDEFDSDLLGTLSTTRNTDNERDARYAVTLQTFDRGSYPVALKLKSNGASSLEADTSVYMRAGTYFNIHAEYGTRIYAAIPFRAAIEDYPLEEESYIFCSEGIYFVDWTGDVHLVVENP